LIETVIRRRFPYKTPYWDLTIASNYLGSDSCLVFLRANHSVMDGYSHMKLFFKLCGVEQLSSDGPRAAPSKPSSFSLVSSATFSYKIGTEGLADYLRIWNSLPQRNIFRNGPLVIGNPAYFPSGEWYCARTPKIALTQVKAARKALETSFYCILFSAVVGGLKAFINSKNWNDKKFSLPDSVKTIFPVSKPGHPDNTLCNHWYAICI